MSDHAVQLESIYKKFRRGEIYDSLRDLIPAITRGLFKRNRDLAGDREFWALEDVSFEVSRGQAFAIIGPNGAGKSTILKLLSRVMRPTRGELRIDGRISALIEVGAGFHPDLTGRENIFLNGSILGMSRAEISTKLDRIVEFAGLSEFIDTPVKRYSSGMYARLGFSVAAHVDPEILLVDEVLSVGDYVFQTRCLQRMREIRDSGATILFVSHNLQAITELCSHGVLLDKGRVIADGGANEIVGTYLKRSQENRESAAEREGHFVSATLRDETGAKVRFRAGERAWLDVEFTTRVPLKNVAIGLAVLNESYYRIFNTSTERLGARNWDTEPGERYRITFELQLHLAQGTFHVGLWLFRSDITREYDQWVPCATLHVGSDADGRGSANLYPKVIAIDGKDPAPDR